MIPDWLQWVFAAGGAIITILLGIIAYFLSGIHADFKEMKTEIIKINQWKAVSESLFQIIENRLKILEKKVLDN